MTASSLTDALSPPSLALVLAVAEAAVRRPAFANISRVRAATGRRFGGVGLVEESSELIQFSHLHPCSFQLVNVVNVQGSQAEAVCWSVV